MSTVLVLKNQTKRVSSNLNMHITEPKQRISAGRIYKVFKIKN
ncbi:hypothetical protein PALI_a3575 [Pseudoalteromonas aliena SW19]|uniref:Uncharacterized protein n=1 Tax=Pseudoalteromonas aliena SW19 TaxID=1314866 RepID=A0ABR9DWM9_9GAMM|nr:hypothetical protein [Pseudoalteromonas aliena SW19]